MPIAKADLEKMNELLVNGSTIANIHRKFSQYDYWEIYWEVSDFSFLGKKRRITNRIRKLANSRNPTERNELAEETQTLLNELYEQLKVNSRKLRDIDRALRK